MEKEDQEIVLTQNESKESFLESLRKTYYMIERLKYYPNPKVDINHLILANQVVNGDLLYQNFTVTEDLYKLLSKALGFKGMPEEEKKNLLENAAIIMENSEKLRRKAKSNIETEFEFLKVYEELSKDYEYLLLEFFDKFLLNPDLSASERVALKKMRFYIAEEAREVKMEILKSYMIAVHLYGWQKVNKLKFESEFVQSLIKILTRRMSSEEKLKEVQSLMMESLNKYLNKYKNDPVFSKIINFLNPWQLESKELQNRNLSIKSKTNEVNVLKDRKSEIQAQKSDYESQTLIQTSNALVNTEFKNNKIQKKVNEYILPGKPKFYEDKQVQIENISKKETSVNTDSKQFQNKKLEIKSKTHEVKVNEELLPRPKFYDNKEVQSENMEKKEAEINTDKFNRFNNIKTERISIERKPKNLIIEPIEMNSLKENVSLKIPEVELKGSGLKMDEYMNKKEWPKIENIFEGESLYETISYEEEPYQDLNESMNVLIESLNSIEEPKVANQEESFLIFKNKFPESEFIKQTAELNKYMEQIRKLNLKDDDLIFVEVEPHERLFELLSADTYLNFMKKVVPEVDFRSKAVIYQEKILQELRKIEIEILKRNYKIIQENHKGFSSEVVDFLLRTLNPSVEEFINFFASELIKAGNIKSYETSLSEIEKQIKLPPDIYVIPPEGSFSLDTEKEFKELSTRQGLILAEIGEEIATKLIYDEIKARANQ